MQKSRVEVKVQALGVVELRPLLVLPPTVNSIVEVAIVDPVLWTDRRHVRCAAGQNPVYRQLVSSDPVIQ